MHLEEAPLSASALQRLQQGVLDNHPQIYGSAVAFQPDQEAPVLYAPYAWRQQDTIAFRDLGESYNYLEKNWFQAPLHQAQPRWSEPYFDDGGGDSLMTTYSVPFYRIQGGVRKLAGVVTADLELGWLDKALTSIKVLDTGYMFLLTQEGQVIYHPSREHVLRHITKTPAAEAAAE